MAGIEAGILNVLIAPKLVSDFASKLGFDLEKNAGDAGEKAGESLGKRLGEGFTKTGKDLTKKVTAPIVAGFGLLVTNALKVDEAFDTIRVKTGLTGEAAKELEQSFKNVASGVPASFQEVADNIAKLSVEFEGLKGKTLEEVSTAFLQLKEVTGEALDEKAFADVAKRFKIPADQVVGSLDQLLRASQNTGISVGDLTAALESNAGILTELGFSYTDSIAFLGQLEKAGFNSTQVLVGLRKAYLTAVGGDKAAEAAQKDIDKANAANIKATADLEVAQLRLQELQAKGTAGSKEYAKEQERIAKLQEKLAEKTRALADANASYTELSSVPTNLGEDSTEKKAKLTEKLRIKTLELASAQQKLNEKLADPKATASAIADAKIRVEKVTSEISGLKQEIAKPIELKFATGASQKSALEKARKLQEEIAKIQAEIDKGPKATGGAAGSEILEQQNKIAQLQQEIKNNSDVVTGAQKEIDSSVSKSGKSIGEFTLESINNIKKLSAAGDEAAANAKAKELFGKSAIEVLQALDAGAFDFAALSKEIAFGTESIATAFAATVDFPQQVEIFRNRLGIALQPIGAKLFPVLEKAISTILPILEKIINVFTSLPEGVQTTILVIAGLAAAVGPALVGIGQLITAFTAVGGAQAIATAATTAFNIALRAVPWIALATVIIAAIVLIVKNWDKVKAVALGALDAIRDGIGAAVNWIKSNWQLLGAILLGPFGPAVLLITKNWDKIKDGARAAVDFIKRIFGGVTSGIANGFASGIGKAITFLTNLRNGAQTVVKAILNFFNTMVVGIANAINRLLNLKGFSTVVKVASAIGGAIASLPGLAEGGPMQANKPYIVGELGPEIVVPKTAGTVLPNNVLSGVLGGGAGANYTVNVYNPVAETSSASIPAALRRSNLLRSSS